MQGERLASRRPRRLRRRVVVKTVGPSRPPPSSSQDMGHAKEGDTDSYLARPDIVKESIRQHQLGALVTLCWHAVPPTADEPITFRRQPGATTQGPLASVQGQLQDEQFKDLLTPGTPLYQKWCQQVDVIAAYRTVCGLRPLTVPQQQAPAQKIDLSGTWVFSEEKSVQDNRGFGMHADQMQIVQKDNQLQIQRSFVVEYADDRLTDETYPLDGTEVKSEFWNSPRLTTATLSQLGDAVLFKSTVTINRGGQTSEMLTHEQWTLQDGGKTLLIRQTSTSPRGQRKLILAYDRKL